eukprot:scaffold59498_cov17-Tisochrysis_lutea.AAC.1
MCKSQPSADGKAGDTLRVLTPEANRGRLDQRGRNATWYIYLMKGTGRYCPCNSTAPQQLDAAVPIG